MRTLSLQSNDPNRNLDVLGGQYSIGEIVDALKEMKRDPGFGEFGYRGAKAGLGYGPPNGASTASGSSGEGSTGGYGVGGYGEDGGYGN